MPRADDDSVFAILDPEDFDQEVFNSDNPPDFTAFIRPANFIVTSVVVGGEAKRFAADPAYVSYSSDELKEIETWLAAHFYKIPNPQLVREEVSTLREVYQQEVKVGMNQTRYGQMAKVIDYKGFLAAMDNAQKDVKTTLPGSSRRAGAYKVGDCNTGGGQWGP